MSIGKKRRASPSEQHSVSRAQVTLTSTPCSSAYFRRRRVRQRESMPRVSEPHFLQWPRADLCSQGVIDAINGLTMESNLKKSEIRLFCDDDKRWVEKPPKGWYDRTKYAKGGRYYVRGHIRLRPSIVKWLPRPLVARSQRPSDERTNAQQNRPQMVGTLYAQMAYERPLTVRLHSANSPRAGHIANRIVVTVSSLKSILENL